MGCCTAVSYTHLIELHFDRKAPHGLYLIYSDNEIELSVTAEHEETLQPITNTEPCLLYTSKNLTELANNWLSQDEGNPRNPETDPITEEELARRISMTSLSVTSGGSFTAWFDCDEMFTDHAVTVYGSLKKGLKAASIEG